MRVQMGCSRTIEIMEREGKLRGAAALRAKKALGRGKFKTLVFVMLSARTKDEATLQACMRLFAKASNAQKIAAMDLRSLEKILYGVGFYKTKARHLKELCKMIVSDFGGAVPATPEALISLPGVGRKTANVVLGQAFGKDEIGVDVHVHRVSNRLGWIKTKTPLETEKALKRMLPKKLWKKCNIAMVSFGQTLCTPRNPKCGECPLRECCKRIGIGTGVGIGPR